jgi:hypothetical protein
MDESIQIMHKFTKWKKNESENKTKALMICTDMISQIAGMPSSRNCLKLKRKSKRNPLLQMNFCLAISGSVPG